MYCEDGEVAGLGYRHQKVDIFRCWLWRRHRAHEGDAKHTWNPTSLVYETD
jgi:hypothetical protein